MWYKIIESSNLERPEFRNFKSTKMEITKDEFFFYLRIYFFIFQNDKVSEI